MKALNLLLSLLPYALAVPAVLPSPIVGEVLEWDANDVSVVVPPRTLEEYTDELLFSLNTEDFVSRRQNITDKPSGYHLIFESNSCGDAPNDPLSFNFKIACDRLSFGIRNYRAQNRLTPKNINAINEQFLVDMESACDAKWYRKTYLLCHYLAMNYMAIANDYPDFDDPNVEDIWDYFLDDVYDKLFEGYDFRFVDPEYK